MFAIDESFIELVKVRQCDDFPHYDAYWFLNSLEGIKEVAPVPCHYYSMLSFGVIDSEEAKYWELCENWMERNRVSKGVFWIDDAPERAKNAIVGILQI